MRIFLQIALGIVAAIGGFVDIGDLVFNTQAGALFGYDLLWAVAVGVIGIMVYAEMCGRVAAVTGRPVFDVIRERLGFGAGLVALIASQAINLLTLAAELGGVAFVLTYLFDGPFSLFVLVAAGGLVLVIRALPFGAIERVFGYGGLLLFVFVAAAIHQGPDWGAVASGFVPQAPSSLLYAYFVVGLVAAALMPYEVYFYSSGGVEERWTPKDIKVNRLNVAFGYGIGALLAFGLMMTAAQLLAPAGIDPNSLGTVALQAELSFGQTGLLLALGGILFAVGGAAIDACFSGAYNLSQFLGWEWGRYRGVRQAPRFTIAWLTFIALAVAVVLTGIDPIEITEYAVIFSVVALPLTYLPVLLIARDREFMGDHANGPIANVMGRRSAPRRRAAGRRRRISAPAAGPLARTAGPPRRRAGDPRRQRRPCSLGGGRGDRSEDRAEAAGRRAGPRPRRRRPRPGRREAPAGAPRGTAMSRDRLSDLQRKRVVTESGQRLGHVFDVAARLERPDRPPQLRALLVGRGGLARRLGIGRGRVTEVPIDRITRVEGGTVVVRDLSA